MNQKLYDVVVNSSSFGKLNGTTIYITQDLFEHLTVGDGSNSGLTLSLLQNGRALRGMKHLMERLQQKRNDAKLVLTLGPTHREANRYFINFEDYRRSAQRKFYQMYRSVGLEVSLDFLVENYSGEFDKDRERITEAQVDAAQRNLPNLVESLGRKERNRPVIMDGAANVVRGLTSRSRVLRKEIEALQRLRSESNITHYKMILEELNDRLFSGKTYHEVRGVNSWQNWIFRNGWLFGPMYLEPIDRERVGFREIPDFLFPTLDGFMDILEIKLPTKDAIVRDRNRYTWSSDVNRSIGQVVDYIHKMELNQLQLTRDISRVYSERLGGSVAVMRPRAFILIGTENGWTEGQRESHRQLNYALHEIEVITYNELLRRGKSVIELYEGGEPSETAPSR